MAWFISKLSIVFPIKMEKLYQPMQGNWVSRFTYANSDEIFPLSITDSISIKNDDLELIYVGFIREKVSSVDTTYCMCSGRSMNNKSPISMQSIQQPVTTLANTIAAYSNQKQKEMLDLATELNYNGIKATQLSRADFLYTPGVQDNTEVTDSSNYYLSNNAKTAISGMNQTQLQELYLLQLRIAQDGNGTFVIGDSPMAFELEINQESAIAVGSNFIEVPLQKFDKIYNNIRAVEYTENSTIIWT